MKSNKEYQTINIKVVLSPEEKDRAKSYAKEKGFTFQGWVGNLIKSEIRKARA